MKNRHITAMLILLTVALQATAQLLTKTYNTQRPVVIASDCTTPPYLFVNNKGELSGVDADILKLVLEKMDLPYIFIVRGGNGGSNDFDTGDADLMLTDYRRYANTPAFISETILSYNRVSKDSVAEIHFIGRDRHLIEQMDDQYARLRQNGDISDVKNRWMHPELVKTDVVEIILYTALGLLLLAVVLYLFVLLVRRHVRHVTRNSAQLNEMMYKVLHMGNYDVMLYDIKKNLATNQYGTVLPEKGLTLEEYIQRIHPDEREEFVRKSKSLHVGRERHFTLDKRWNEGTEEHPHYLNFQGHAICETDENGQPAYVINAVYDVTREKEEYQATRVIEHKYKAILCDPFVPMSLYDRKGNLLDHNDAMNQLLSGIDSSLFKEVFKPEERPDVTFTRHLYYPEYGIDKYVECHIQPLYDAKGEMANYLVTTKSLPPAT